jgi:hypothetical protein
MYCVNTYVVYHPIGTERSCLTLIKTLTTLPYLIFNIPPMAGQGTQSRNTKASPDTYRDKELKMPTNYLPTPAANYNHH